MLEDQVTFDCHILASFHPGHCLHLMRTTFPHAWIRAYAFRHSASALWCARYSRSNLQTPACTHELCH